MRVYGRGSSVYELLSRVLFLKNVLPLIVFLLMAGKTQHMDRGLRRGEDATANEMLP